MIAMSPTRSSRKLTDNAERDLGYLGVAILLGATLYAALVVTDPTAFRLSPTVIGLLIGAGILVMWAPGLVADGIADAGWIERKTSALSRQAYDEAMQHIRDSLAEGRPATRRSVYAAISAAREAEIAHAQHALLS